MKLRATAALRARLRSNPMEPPGTINHKAKSRNQKIRKSDSLLAVGLLGITGFAFSANSANAQQAPSPPSFLFQKAAAPDGTLYAYMSFGTIRASYSFRSGSGNGSNDECATSAGWLPNGNYSSMNLYYKTWGVSVVQGWVWELPNKTCYNGSVTRTELFVHSSGIEGTAWSDSNYKSAGCVKLNQDDRQFLRTQYQGADQQNQATMAVM
jgi:hypothetical protein